MSDETVMDDPSRLAQPRHAALAACWFWSTRKLNTLAGAGTKAAFNQISVKINGGEIGKQARLDHWAEARAALLA
jgi:putative chitinase